MDTQIASFLMACCCLIISQQWLMREKTGLALVWSLLSIGNYLFFMCPPG